MLHAVVPEEGACYIDPTRDAGPVDACPECGGTMVGCDQVFDTWMDSSITPLYNTFWERDGDKHDWLYPMSLRPQAHDIIRTWLFATVVRSHHEHGKVPWAHAA